MNWAFVSGWHVGVAGEAIATALFGRCGYDVSVQYGANQPKYDLMVAKGEKTFKVSVKGSQDGSWGLCQSQLEQGRADNHDAIDRWVKTAQGAHCGPRGSKQRDVAVSDVQDVRMAQ